MRIGLLVPSFLKGKGGAEKVAAEVANVISIHGGAASILANPSRNADPSYPVHPDVDIRQITLRDDQEILAERNRYDAVLGFGMGGFFARIPEIANLLSVPFAIQECTNPWRMVSTLYIRRQEGCRTLEDAFWLRQAVFSQASAVRFTVPGYAASVLPVISPFTYAFYNSLARPTQKRTNSLTRKIICVGAMKNTNKNGMAAVRAFADFAEGNQGWELHLYGQNNFRGELAEVQRKVPGRIVDHGIEADISRMYSDAALLVIPSFEEGLPNVVVEAFSFGVPCIGFSDCHGVRHLIADGQTGLLVDRVDPKALSSALDRAADDGLRAAMSQKAFAFAEENLGPEDFEANWLRLLTNVIAGRNRDGCPQLPTGIARTEPYGRLLPKLLKQAHSSDLIPVEIAS